MPASSTAPPPLLLLWAAAAVCACVCAGGGAAAGVPAATVLAGPGNNEDAAVLGDLVVFFSNRSGPPALWALSLADPGSVAPLTGGGLDADYYPSLARDAATGGAHCVWFRVAAAPPHGASLWCAPPPRPPAPVGSTHWMSRARSFSLLLCADT